MTVITVPGDHPLSIQLDSINVTTGAVAFYLKVQGYIKGRVDVIDAEAEGSTDELTVRAAMHLRAGLISSLDEIIAKATPKR